MRKLFAYDFKKKHFWALITCAFGTLLYGHYIMVIDGVEIADQTEEEYARDEA